MKNLSKKKIFKLIFYTILILFIGTFLVDFYRVGKKSTHSVGNNKTIKVGVVGQTDDPLWQQTNKNLKRQHKHIRVKLVHFSDGIQANQAQSNHELDLTAFQNLAFLQTEEKEKHYKFTVIGNSYISPMNIYSKEIKNLKQIKKHGKVAIPNNSTNAGRALEVLQTARLIKLNSKKGTYPSIQDITYNPHHLKIMQVDPSKIVNLLPDFSAGITNSNFIQAAHMDPIKDSIFHLSPDFTKKYNKPWINIIVARKGEENKIAYKKVVQAYQTPSVAKIMNSKLHNVDIPAFKY